MDGLETRRIGSFSEIEEQWKDLLNRAAFSTIFQTYEWNERWWHHLSRGEELFLLGCFRDGKMVGLAPLKRYISKVRGLLSFKVLSFIGCPESDYHDFLLDEECAPEALEAIFLWLRRNIKEWDILRIPEIPQDSPSNDYLETVLYNNNFFINKRKQSACPYIDIPECEELYLYTLSSTTKKNYKYYKKRLCKLGNFSTILITNVDESEQAMEDLFNLNTKRWESVGQKGSFPTEQLRQFHKEISKILFKHIDLFFIELDGKRIACNYSFKYKKNIGLYLPGWDIDYKDYRVGSLIIMERIKEAIKQGYHVFDFLRGDENYKFMFTKKVKYNTEYHLSHIKYKLLLYLAIERISKKWITF